MHPTFRTAAQAAPPPPEAIGPVWPISDHEARRIHDQTAAERAARRAAEADAPAPTRQQPERKSAAEAASLIEMGRNGLRMLDAAAAALKAKREEASAAVKQAEAALETLKSVTKTAWDLHIANPLAPKPAAIENEVREHQARIDAARYAYSIAVADEQEAQPDFAKARADARALIAAGEHHQRLNQIERLADRAETLHREAACAMAQVSGIREYSALHGDTIGAQYAGLAENGQHRRLPQEEADRRAALRKECEAIRAKFREHGLKGGQS